MSEILTNRWKELAFAKDSTTVLLENHSEKDHLVLETDETDEGNAFTGARQDAIDKHEDEFEVDGETYPVEGEKKYAFMEIARHYIRELVLEQCEACNIGMPCDDNDPAIAIEIEEEVVEPVLDMITNAFQGSDSYPEEHVDSAGRMFDYGHQKSDSHEGRMSKAKLFRMGKMAQSLHDRLEDGDDLPGWVQDKITTAEDRLESAYDYMDYKIHRMEKEESPCGASISASLEEI